MLQKMEAEIRFSNSTKVKPATAALVEHGFSVEISSWTLAGTVWIKARITTEPEPVTDPYTCPFPFLDRVEAIVAPFHGVVEAAGANA